MSAFPTNTIILILAGLVVAAFFIWYGLSETLRQLSLPTSIQRNWRWGVGLVLALWFGVRVALALNPPGGTVLPAAYVFGFVIFGFAAGTLPLLLSQTFRQIIRAAPVTWVIGIHAVRVIGGLFLVLLDMNLLPAEFARPAGYGDVTVAILSVVVVYLLLTRKPYARTAAIIWNLLGMLDLITALTTGTLYITPFATQLAASGVSLLYLNYALMIPAFGVPLVGVFHFYSLYQLLSRQKDTVDPGVVAFPAVRT